jgi:hypothetical protein
VETELRDKITLVGSYIVSEATVIGLEFAAKVVSTAEAYLLSEDVLTKTKKYVTPMQVCAMLVEINDPCICSQIKLALMYAVQEHKTLTSYHGNRFSIA